MGRTEGTSILVSVAILLRLSTVYKEINQCSYGSINMVENEYSILEDVVSM